MTRADEGEAGNQVEDEIQAAIARAMSGSFDARIQLDGLEGFTHAVAEGINMLLDVVEEPIREIISSQTRLGEGDLTSSMQGLYLGQFERVKAATNHTIATLAGIVRQVREESREIEQTLRAIAEEMRDLRSRTSLQESNLDKARTSVENLTHTIQDNEERARDAARTFDQAASESEHGEATMKAMRESMDAIDASSLKIRDAIGIVDEVAFHTNLLALNAAVEAARAGEHGRGFAVVAAEVRALSERSKQSAKAIQELVSESIALVARGSSQASETAEALSRMIESVKTAAELSTSILEASRAQSDAAVGFSDSIAEIHSATRENALLAERLDERSSDAETRAARLVEVMAFFDCGEAVATAPSSPDAEAAGDASAKESEDEFDFFV